MKNDLMIFERKDHAVVSSRVIADRFNKRHQEVIYAIEGRPCDCMGAGCKKCSFRGYQQLGILQEDINSKSHLSKMFIKSHYTDSMNRTQREYLMNRDGFALLAMGFTGKEALKWKLKYINAFNQMEAFIQERRSSEWLVTRKQGKLIRRMETDTLANLVDYAEAQGSRNMRKRVYTIYSQLVNSLVGIQSGERETAPFKTISVIAFLEDMILHTVDEEMQKRTHYKDIYKICKANGEQIMRFAYLPAAPKLSA